MKSAVIVFPGSNCDRDGATVLESVTGKKPHMVWHQETVLPEVDLVFLPGGFSYGDYLRSGAMAARSPIMQAVRAHANKGAFVMGVCNGFQVLTETGLLPGTLMRNRDQKFICKTVHLRTESTQSPFTGGYQPGQVLAIPVAHHDGCYVADKLTLKKLNYQEQIAFRYCDAAGEVSEASNPNGSMENIAGILNESRNVLGMMPHPERHAEDLLGGVDGRMMFKSLLAA